MVAHTIDRRGEKKNKRKRAAEEITASLGHINRQKNVTSARKDDKRRGCGSVILGSAKGQHEREREKLDGWWKETRTREGMTWLTTVRQKKKEKKKKSIMATLCWYFVYLRWRV